MTNPRESNRRSDRPTSRSGRGRAGRGLQGASAPQPTSGLSASGLSASNVSPSGEADLYTYMDVDLAFQKILNNTPATIIGGYNQASFNVMQSFAEGVGSLLSESGGSATVEQREKIETKGGGTDDFGHKVAVIDSQATPEIIDSTVETLKEEARIMISDDLKEQAVTQMFDAIKTEESVPGSEFVILNQFNPKPMVMYHDIHPALEWMDVEEESGGGGNGGGSDPTLQRTCIEGVNSKAADAIETYLPPAASVLGRESDRYVLAYVPVGFLSDLRTFDGVVDLHSFESDSCGAPRSSGGGGNGGGNGGGGGDDPGGDTDIDAGGSDRIIAGVPNSTLLLAGGGLTLAGILAAGLGDDSPSYRYRYY